MISYEKFVRRAVSVIFLLMMLLAFLVLTMRSDAQTAAPLGLMPIPRQCFTDASGNPLALGYIYSYQAGTTTPQATYSDNTGLYQNQNPQQLDSAGCWTFWLGSGLSYKVRATTQGGSQVWVVDNVSDLGAIAYTKALLLNPPLNAEQDVSGPIGAPYFITTGGGHVTSPGVRVSFLAPTFTLDTALNPPSVNVTQPATGSQVYTVPDPGTPTGAFIVSPGQTTNVLDCTATGLTCRRQTYIYLEGAGCNNATAGLGWDTFGTNTPLPLCVTGSNTQKGVMALPSATTKAQESVNTGSAATTATVTYPAATSAGDFLIAVVAVDGGKTVSGVTDGTNAYTKAISKTNGNTDCEIWYFNGNSTAMPASTTLTATLSAAANSVINWFAYKDIKTSGALDQTASNSATVTAVTTGTTLGTAQNTELVFSAVCMPGNTAIANYQSGTTPHVGQAQGTNISMSSEGLVQQATATQQGTFTLASSQAWAAAIATFKANVAGTITAQRQFLLPATYLSTGTVNSTISWQNPLLPIGTINVKLGAAVGCGSAGGTDDNALNAATSASAAVNQSGINVLTSTALNNLSATGCAGGSLMHYQVQRLRYDPADTYEGYVYLNGASLSFGVAQ